MRNRRTLHEEISRLKVLMETHLLTESKITNIADTLMRLGDEMMTLIAKHDTVFQRLVRAKDNNEAFKVLGELVNLDKRFADEIIPRVYEALPEETLTLIQKKKDMLSNLKKSSDKVKIDDEIIDSYIQDISYGPFPEVKPIVRKEIKDFLDGVQRNPITEIPSITPPKKGDVADDMRKVFSHWDEISPGTLSAADKFLMSDSWFRGLRAKLKFVISNTLNQKYPFGESVRTKSMEKIVGLIKTATDDLTKRNAINPELYKLIDVELEALRRDKKYVMDLMYNTIESEINKATGSFKGGEIVKNLKKQNPFDPEAESYFKSLLNDNTLLDEVSKVYGKITFGIGDKENLVNIVEGLMLLFQRVLGVLTTGFGTNLKSIFRTLRASGVGIFNGTGALYLYFLGMSKLIWPTFFAIKDYFVNSLITQDVKFDETESAFMYFLEEEFKEAIGIYNEEFLTIFGNEIPQPISKIIRAINPFTNIWKKIKDGTDYWFTQGGLREVITDAVNDSGVAVENLQSELDSITQAQRSQIRLMQSDIQRRADSLRNVSPIDTTSLPGVNTTARTTVPQTSGRNVE
jgi:hypothetical protein